MDPTVSQKSDQLQGLMSTKPKSAKTNRDKKLSKTKGSIGLKRPNPCAENISKPQRSSPSRTNQKLVHGKQPTVFSSCSARLGNMASKQGHSGPRRSDRTNQSVPHDAARLLRPGNESCMEEPLSNHSFQPKNGNSGAGSSEMGLNSKPVVAFLNRNSHDYNGGSNGAEQVKEAISNTSLERIRMASPRKESDRHQGISNNSYGEYSHDEVVPDSQVDFEMRSPCVLQRGYSGNTEVPSTMEAKLDDDHGPSEKFGVEFDGSGNDGV